MDQMWFQPRIGKLFVGRLPAKCKDDLKKVTVVE